jgi:putative SOS response-associated peptidase YedK
MCFHSKQSKSAQTLQNRFKAKFEHIEEYQPSIYNGFTFPKTPVIIDKEPEIIKMYQWGLIPHWAKDNGIRKNTLNARIETIKEKPSFRNSVNKHCLVLADGFYEWKWLDEKGKNKQKYLITLPDDEAFAFAGLYSEWVDTDTGEIINTYTILTTEAKDLMREIHNSKMRMPVILNKEEEHAWLLGQIDKTSDVELKAVEV